MPPRNDSFRLLNVFLAKATILLAINIAFSYTMLWVFVLIKESGFTLVEIIIYTLLILICGISIGGLSIEGINIYAILALGSSAAVLIPKLINAPKKQKQLIEQWQKKEQYLIEP